MTTSPVSPLDLYIMEVMAKLIHHPEELTKQFLEAVNFVRQASVVQSRQSKDEEPRPVSYHKMNSREAELYLRQVARSIFSSEEYRRASGGAGLQDWEISACALAAGNFLAEAGIDTTGKTQDETVYLAISKGFDSSTAIARSKRAPRSMDRDFTKDRDFRRKRAKVIKEKTVVLVLVPSDQVQSPRMMTVEERKAFEKLNYKPVVKPTMTIGTDIDEEN